MINKSHNRSGIALISVMVVVALISASVSLMWQGFGTDFKQTKYTLNQTHALNHLYNMEAWAKVILTKDDDTIDSIDESWTTQITPIQIPGGLLHGRLIDLQSKLNINSMIDLQSDAYMPQYRSFYYDCLNRLNTQLNQAQMADTIFSFVISQSPKPKLLKHESLVKTIQTIPIEDYLNIKPYLFALPSLIPININTASKEVLSCIHPQLYGDLVEQIIEQRKKEPFYSIDQFWVFIQSILPHLTLEQIKDDLRQKNISTRSDYFLLEVEIRVDDNKLLGQTILHRKDGKITVMNRSYRQTQ